MSFFFLRAAKRYLVSIAVIDACPPESDARSAFLRPWCGEVAGVIVEMTHPSRQDIRQFLANIWKFGTDTSIHETRLLLGMPMNIHKQQLLILTLHDNLLNLIYLRIQHFIRILPLSI